MTAGPDVAFAAVVVAAGSGERLGADLPKALVEVAGAPLVRTAVARLLESGAGPVVVVGPSDHLDAVRAALDGLGPSVAVVPGGATRADSVREGLTALGDAAPALVAVHDAARAYAPVATIHGAVRAVVDDVVAAAPARPVADTLKRVAPDGTVVATVDREVLAAVQTPQVFRRDVLVEAHRGAPGATDDLALVEAALADGRVTGRVVVVDGSPLAAKVTWPHDVVLVEAMLADQEVPT